MAGARGQSETLGFVFIVALTLVSAGAIAVAGGAALDTTQERIGTQTAENAMSQFDARASLVGLGATSSQSVPLGDTGEGTYRVDPAAGWLRIVHENETAGEQELYNGTLGAVVYENGGTEIAYQAGGVWRRDAGSVMLSPPAFQYRGSTLTLPLLSVNGSGTVGGRPVASVRQAGPGSRVFPNSTSPGPSTNPVDSGLVSVTVNSEYYAAWARYFETRTAGNVTVDEASGTATLELVSPATDGDFQLPQSGHSMSLQGLQGHPIDTFELKIYPDEGDEANFNNLMWSLCAKSGTRGFAIDLGKGDLQHNGSAEARIYYSSDGSSYHAWTTDAFRYQTEDGLDEDWDGDGDQDETRLVVDLASAENATYRDVKWETECSYEASNFQEDATFEGHDGVGEPRNYSTGDEEAVSFVVNHYLSLLGPSVDLTVQDKGGDRVSEELSTGRVEYNASEGYYLTYMHVTENPLNVTLRSR